MEIKAVLFDLDGTLLPMDQDVFAKAYIGGLAAVAAAGGYDSKKMVSAIMEGTLAMVNNTGERTNEETFWAVLADRFGESVMKDYYMFDEFYRTDFQRIKDYCGYEPRAKEVVERVKKKGLRAALATNPLFPSAATESRIRWAGLEVEDFELFTSYETSRHCKPNIDYYRDVLAKMGLAPEECVMVGNDAHEDMVAATLGMRVFLLTDCLINRKEADISAYPHGGFDDLLAFIDGLC